MHGATRVLVMHSQRHIVSWSYCSSWRGSTIRSAFCAAASICLCCFLGFTLGVPFHLCALGAPSVQVRSCAASSPASGVEMPAVADCHLRVQPSKIVAASPHLYVAKAQAWNSTTRCGICLLGSQKPFEQYASMPASCCQCSCTGQEGCTSYMGKIKHPGKRAPS